MRSIRSIQAASWLLDHFSCGEANETLAGDLLEEFHSGRSAIWYWRQVAAAISLKLSSSVPRIGLLLAFSTAWALLYPLWRPIARLSLSEVSDKGISLAWPLSSLVEILCAVLPAGMFVWIGCAVYLSLTTPGTKQWSMQIIMPGLLRSLTVLLLGTVALLYRFGHPQPDLACLTRADFYVRSSPHNISLLLGVSLFAALLGFPRLKRGSRVPYTAATIYILFVLPFSAASLPYLERPSTN